jgi:hypothetical protein
LRNEGHATYNANCLAQDAYPLYHLVHEQSEQGSSVGGGPALPALGHAIAGSAATAVSKLLMYPLDLVITRLQVQRQLHGPGEAPSAAKDADAEYANLVDAARKIYSEEGGLSAFYTGCAPDVAKGLADSFLFFLAYTYLRQREQRRHGHSLPVMRELGVGVVAGALAKLVTTPLQNIITRQQTAALIAARSPLSGSATRSDKLTISDVASQIRRERGLQGFWAGYSASIILTLNPSITFAVDNLLHRILPSARREHPGHVLTFLIAATSKVVATTITYPVSLAKSRAQVGFPALLEKAEGTEKSRYDPGDMIRPRKTFRDRLRSSLRLLSAQYAIILSLREIYQSEGAGGLYSGLEAEVIKGFLSHGLTMVMKDRVHVGVIQLYYVLLKLTRQWPEKLHDIQESASHAVEEVKDRADNVGTTVIEGVKHSHVVDDVREKVFSASESLQHSSLAEQVKQQAENVGAAVKSGVEYTQLGEVKDKAQSIGASVVGEVRERAEDVGATVAEGVKKIV